MSIPDPKKRDPDDLNNDGRSDLMKATSDLVQASFDEIKETQGLLINALKIPISDKAAKQKNGRLEGKTITVNLSKDPSTLFPLPLWMNQNPLGNVPHQPIYGQPPPGWLRSGQMAPWGSPGLEMTRGTANVPPSYTFNQGLGGSDLTVTMGPTDDMAPYMEMERLRNQEASRRLNLRRRQERQRRRVEDMARRQTQQQMDMDIQRKFEEAEARDRHEKSLEKDSIYYERNQKGYEAWLEANAKGAGGYVPPFVGPPRPPGNLPPSGPTSGPQGLPFIPTVRRVPMQGPPPLTEYQKRMQEDAQKNFLQRWMDTIMGRSYDRKLDKNVDTSKEKIESTLLSMVGNKTALEQARLAMDEARRKRNEAEHQGYLNKDIENEYRGKRREYERLRKEERDLPTQLEQAREEYKDALAARTLEKRMRRTGEKKRMMGEVASLFGMTALGNDLDYLGSREQLQKRAKSGDPDAIEALGQLEAGQVRKLAQRRRAGVARIGEGLQAITQTGSAMGALSGAGEAVTGLGMATANPTLVALGTFTKVLSESVDGLMRWNGLINESNFQFAQYSGAMAQVRTEQQVRDIQLSRERGDRRADMARLSAESAHRLNRNLAPLQDDMMGFFSSVKFALNETVSTLMEVARGGPPADDPNANPSKDFKRWASDLITIDDQRAVQGLNRPQRFQHLP